MHQNEAPWAQWLADDDASTVVLVDHEGEAAAYRQWIAAQQGEKAYLEQVRVLPKAQWLVELWDSSFPNRQVLRPVQLLVLAERCVEDSNLLPETVIGSQGITQRFVDAFELAERYELEIGREFSSTAEQQAFADWQQALRSALSEQALLSAGQLPRALLESLQAGQLELPARLAMSHALEISPLEGHFFDALISQGVERVDLQPFKAFPAGQGRVQQYCAPDFASEVAAAASWAASQLASPQSDAGIDAMPRLAIVGTNIRPYEEALRRALERYVYPYALYPGEAPGQLLTEPWRIGSGHLANYPVVASALDILMVSGAEVELEMLSRVLRSPFVAEATAMRARRARLDLHWREHLSPRCSLSQALHEAQYSDFGDATAFLESLRRQVAEHARRAMPSRWVECFDAELLAAGWPNREAGDAVLDQCRQGFSQVMDTLRALDRQLGAVGRAEALRWLQHVLKGKRFELKRDQTPPLQILDIEKARGQVFDAIWVLGLTDSALPIAVEPSPFLPREQLRAAGVPRADHADALQRDRALLAELMQSAPQCIVSVPGQDADGIAHVPCSLLDWQAYPPWQEAITEQGYADLAELQLPERDLVRPVSDEEKQQLRGGTGLFKAYALSPFYAFLKYRLGLQAMPTPVEGLEPRLQGAWVHAVLEFFWQEVRFSHVLKAYASEELEQQVDRAIAQAMKRGGIHGEELMRIEKRRIRTLVLEWLEFEKLRDEEFTVESTEQRGRVDAFGIPLSVQFDRLDRIGDHRLIIDYKTGTVAANSLNAENLLEPQLPLYALLADSFAGEIDGIALAQVHARDGMKVHMRSSWASNLVAKSVRNPVDTLEKWQGECEAWRKVLQQYASGFLNGDIAHDYQQVATAFAYDPYVLTLARGAEVLADD